MSGSDRPPLDVPLESPTFIAHPDGAGKGGVSRSVRVAPFVVSLGVGAVTATLFVIWLLAPALKEFSSATMKANSAATICVAAMALWFLAGPKNARTAKRRQGGRLLGFLVVAMGAATMLEYLFDWDLGIDELFVEDFPNQESLLFPGRMSPIAGGCFFLLGATLVSLHARRPKWTSHLAAAFALPLLVVNVVALTGYLYGVRNFYQLGPYIRIAWPTAVCFILLASGALAADPESGFVRYFTGSNIAAAVSRRLLPAVVALPLVFGWIRLWAQKQAYVGLELGTALFAVSLILVLCTVVWLNARALDAAEREREKTAGLFRSFFSLGLVGMGQADVRTGKLLRANSKLEEITGYAAAELNGMPFADFTHPEDRARDRGAFGEMLEGKREAYSTEKRYVTKDGRTVWVLVNVARVHEGSDEAPAAVAVIQDITFLKEAQEKLEEALRLREEFLSIASHELKTPLTALLMQVQSVQRLVAREPGLSRYEQRLKRAVDSALRLDKLIVQLLDVSRLTEGRLPLEPERVELGGLVGEVVSRFHEAAEQAGSPITLLANGPVEGTWDRLRIDQVVTNLVSNALKYGAGQPVEVSVRASGSEAQVAVRDHGIGMNDEQLGRIFRRFERGVEARSYGGFGLGLWIGMEIARASGGTIDVDSIPGEGARFTLRLPIRSAD